MSDAKVRPGAQLTDKVVVTGAGALELTVQRRALRAVPDHGRDLVLGHAVLDGHGRRERATARTRPRRRRSTRSATTPTASRSRRAPQTAAFTGQVRRDVGDVARHRGADASTTEVSDDVVAPGRDALRLDQRHRARQLARRRSSVELFGPFATRAAIKCTGTPYDTARGLRQGRRHAARRRRCGSQEAGFYTYRERLVGTDLIARGRRPSARTWPRRRSRGRSIITGRNDRTGLAALRGDRPADADARARRRASASTRRSRRRAST